MEAAADFPWPWRASAGRRKWPGMACTDRGDADGRCEIKFIGYAMAHAGLMTDRTEYTGMSRSGAPQLVTRNVLANLGMADEVQKLDAAMADDVKNAERLVDGDGGRVQRERPA